jgi:glutaredoxin
MTFVKMYSADWCYDCQAMLSLFEEKNITYEVVNIDHEPQAIDRLKQICGGKKIVPTLEIEGQVYINPTLESLSTIISTI